MPFPRGRRVAFRALLALLLLVVSRRAEAMLLPHYDVDSLAFQSTAIVLVEKIRDRRVGPYTTLTEVRVKRTYLPASLKEGDILEVDTSSYSVVPMFGWQRDPPPKISPDMVMFFRRQEDHPELPALWLVDSGMRIFVDGLVCRFVQESNPGGYGPTIGEGPKVGVAYDRAGFEVVLQRAVQRAADVHAALAERGSPARTKKLVDLVGPPPVAGADTSQDFGEDAIAMAIIEALGNDHENDAMLDAVSRTRRFDPFHIRTGDAEELVSAAMNARAPVHRRLAALTLLEGKWFDLGDKPALGARLAALFDDPRPAVRKAALRLSFTDGKTPQAWLDAIVRRYAIERDPDVRRALLAAANRQGIGAKLHSDVSPAPR